MSKFYIIHEEYSKQEVYAHDAQEAAETYAREHDGSNDHNLASMFASIEFQVEDETGKRKNFSVTASVSVNYFAEEV